MGAPRPDADSDSEEGPPSCLPPCPKMEAPHQSMMPETSSSTAVDAGPAFNPSKCPKKLGCSAGPGCDHGRPIVMQHFPMFRESDGLCREPDEAPVHVKNATFREKWDCLSYEASEDVYYRLRPRVIFTGHTHYGCHTVHKEDIHEYTIPSFSWRNLDNPTFTMAVLSSSDVAVKKCLMPRESTVISIYTTAACLLVAWVVVRLLCWPFLSKKWWPFHKWKLS